MGVVYDGIMGLVVGDALGVPYEFRPRDSFTATDMVGYGTHNQPAGTWSDDSSMTLATLRSIGQHGKIDPDDIMFLFSQWLNMGNFTPYDKVFDVGGTTRRAIQRYSELNIPPLNCGGGKVTDNGNGALMRILPVVFVSHSDVDVVKVAKLTHAHYISNSACCAYIEIAEKLLSGKGKREIMQTIKDRDDIMPIEFSRLTNLENLSRDEIKSSGYVVDTLEAALWCILKTDNYRDCVLTAVNLGEDTDTTAAVAGGLAGIMYGCGGTRGIPDEWIKKIPKRQWIADLCEAVEHIH